MAEDAKPRQIVKQVPLGAFNATVSGGALPLITATALGNDWLPQIVSAPAGVASYTYRSYLDLAGWAAQELTTFVQGVDVQKGRVPGLASNIVEIVEFDILSTRALTDAECGSQFQLGYVPGYLGSTLDLMQVIYAEQRTYVENSQIAGSYVTTNTETWGSGNPTAMDKMHWTRIYLVTFSNAPGPQPLAVWPTNLVVQAITSKEKDLVWIERLRRSYQLQDPADV